jgi:capsular polysaccharide biosynthesis protein
LELLQIFNLLLRRWWLVLIPVVIVAALTLPALLNRAPAAGGFNTLIQYSAAQSMDAIPRQEGDYQDIWRAAELTVDAFTDWVRGTAYAEEVAAAAEARGVTINPAALAVQADNEGAVGRLYLTWPNGDELSAIADAAIEVLQTRSAAYFAQLGGTPAAVTILSRSPVTAAPPPLTDRFGPFIRIGIGLLAGVALAFLAHYLDPMLRRREDVEALGLPVIASIPKQ